MKHLLFATAGGIALSIALPLSAQLPPAGSAGQYFDQRPLCSDLQRLPGALPGWEKWGLFKDGEFIQFHGMESRGIPAEKAHELLATAGFCALAQAEITPVITERTEGDVDAIESRNGARTQRVESGDSEGNFMGALALLGAGAWFWSRKNGETENDTGTYTQQAIAANQHRPSIYTMPPSEYVDSLPVVNPPVAELMPVEPSFTAVTKSSPSPIEYPTAYRSLLANPYLSRIFYGGQRTGKTMLTAKVSEALASQGVAIYHINLASCGDEDQEYFAHATASVVGDLVSIMDTNQANHLIKEASKVVDAFTQCPRNAILICDEWKFITNKSCAHSDTLEALLVARIADIIAGFESSGMKRAKAIWTAAPGIVAGNMQQSGKAVKGLEPVIVAVAPGHTETWNGQTLTFDHQVFNQVAANYQNITEPIGTFASSRIALISGEWIPLGDYPKAQPKPQQIKPTELDESIFVGWAKQQNSLINYERFRNANALKKLSSRSRERFIQLADHACALGLIFDCGEGEFMTATQSPQHHHSTTTTDHHNGGIGVPALW